MPKSLGFDLYALIVHYVDGDICNCYARKTNEWYYFSDKMDFRIQLGSDNRTITAQQWRRKHFSSSWYVSGLLDYVELMTFGETYLQSELNPMRTDIQNNHTTIVNNYNEYVENKYITDQTIENHYNEFNTFVTDTYDPAIALLQQEITSLHDYVTAAEQTINIKLGNLFDNWGGYAEYANNTSDSIRLLARNYNSLVENVIAAFSHVWGELDGSYGVKLKVDDFNVRGVTVDPEASLLEGRKLVDYAKITEGENKTIEITDEKQNNLENVVKGISDKVDQMYPDYVTFNYLQEYFRGQVSPLWDAIHALQEKLG